ncbi:hypothetical protein JOM56_013133 [Amanita muscaria]
MPNQILLSLLSQAMRTQNCAIDDVDGSTAALTSSDSFMTPDSSSTDPIIITTQPTLHLDPKLSLTFQLQIRLLDRDSSKRSFRYSSYIPSRYVASETSHSAWERGDDRLVCCLLCLHFPLSPSPPSPDMAIPVVGASVPHNLTSSNEGEKAPSGE